VSSSQSGLRRRGLEVAFEAFRQVAEAETRAASLFLIAKQDGDFCFGGDEIAEVTATARACC
jgi:hypothetical protein